MRSRILIPPVVFVLLFCLIPSATGASSMGGKCSKVKSFQLINKKVAICLKKGNTLVWSLANAKQKERYRKIQSDLLVSSREKNLTNLRTLKEKYSDISKVVPEWNLALVQSKKSLIDGARELLFNLEDQKDDQEQVKKDAQITLQTVNNSISASQSNLNSLQNQINSQQSVVNNAKFYNDSAYNTYVSVKAQ